MGGVIVRTICPPRRNNADGGLFLFHGANLNSRSLGADNVTVIKIVALGVWDIERILHLPRRMVGGRVQGVEVVKLVFDIRSIGNLKAHFAENRDNFLIILETG